MPTVSVPHHLDKEEAKRRVSGLLPGLRTEFAGMLSDLQERWEGDVLHFGFKARGLSITGSATVQPSAVALGYSLPLLAPPPTGPVRAGVPEGVGAVLGRPLV